jgi:ribonuclease HI
VKTLDGIPIDDSLNIYTDGSSFPGKKRAAGVGIRLVWMDEAGAEKTHDFAPTGWSSATIDEMEIEACTVGLTEALEVFPDVSRFRKAFIFTDSMYVKDNFVRAMNIWPQQGWKGVRGVRVENVDLWKRLRKVAQSFPIRIEVKWVKGHKTSVHNRAADKLAKQSAAMPFNKPLSVSQTAKKWSDQKTARGCVTIQGQEIKIRIVSTEFKSRNEYEYRYEVIDQNSASFKCVDFVRFDKPLSRHKCLLVRLNTDHETPRIEQVIEELDPAQMRETWQRHAG